MTKFRDSDEFRRGRTGEQVVADWLQKRECYIIPSYDYSGENGDKAPKLQGLWEGHPVPDLDCSRKGHRFWVEVKTKEKPVLWRRDNEWRHGIELRLLEHYQTVQLISGCPCYLFIYEELSGYLLAETLDRLGIPHSGTDRGRKMAYWSRAKFRQLDRITAKDDEAALRDRDGLPDCAKKVCEGACIQRTFTVGLPHGQDKRTPARRRSHPASPPAPVPHPSRGRRAGRRARRPVRPFRPVLHRVRLRQAPAAEGRPRARPGPRAGGRLAVHGRRRRQRRRRGRRREGRLRTCSAPADGTRRGPGRTT